MEKKKIAIIGQGTIGCFSTAYFLAKTDWLIDWYFDSDIEALSVGEGTSLGIPDRLYEVVNFQHSDLLAVKGTPKQGVYKKHWTKEDSNFLHPFPVVNTAMHFAATELQQYLIDRLKGFDRVNIINQHIYDFETVPADFVMVCAGKPKDYNNGDYILVEDIPVNASYIMQCSWEYPRFTYTLSNATKHGWVFGIPLQNRISIGYMYNDKITDLEEIKSDILNVLEEYNLQPTENVRNIQFKSFYKKENFTDKVVYNGNASYFLEPLEATTSTFSDDVNRLALDLWTNNKTTQECQQIYEQELKDTTTINLLHYMAGSVYNTRFWQKKQPNAFSWIERMFQEKEKLSYLMYESIEDPFPKGEKHYRIGQWQAYNYHINIKKLLLEEQITQLYHKYYNGGDEIEGN